MNTLQSSQPKHDKRRSPRATVVVPALIRDGARRYAARVLNISTIGAKLATNANLNVGAKVIFSCGTIEVWATVVWKNGRELGVSFTTELDQAELTRQANRSEAVEALHARRKGETAQPA